MSNQEKIDEWTRFVQANHPSYTVKALLAVYEADGEKMLGAVLNKLKLESSVDLVKRCA